MGNIAGLGAAVIGTGFIGTVHVEALRRLGVQVRGVLGSSPARGAERAAAIGVPKAYGSLEELLADPGVEVVHVTSPNHGALFAGAGESSRRASMWSARSRWP